MNNIYQQLKISKIYLCLVIVLVFGQFTLKAQPYNFTALSGTFTPLTGGSSLSSIQYDDAMSLAINIGFNFKFNGKVYTQTSVSSNGFITFRVGSISSLFSQTDSTFIAPLGYDLSGTSGTASYKTEGTAPNRIFTMEWLNWKWDWLATAGISFQLKLYETSDRIEFIYRQEIGTLNNGKAYIGLSGQKLNTYMYLNNSGTSPEITLSPNYIMGKPATGQIYRFDPNILPEATNHAGGFSPVTAESLAVKWTDAIGANLPSRYIIKVSNVGFNAITDPVDGIDPVQDLDLTDGTGAAICNYSIQKFNGWTDSLGLTNYYFKIFPISNYNTYTNYKTDGSVPQFYIITPAYDSKLLTSSGITANLMDLSWVRGSYAKCAVFAKENGAGKALPQNNTSYTANAVYGSGAQIGTTGWFCVFNGTGTSVSLSGLKTNTPYDFHAIEYDGAAGAEQYSTGDSPSANKIFNTSLFSEVNLTLTGIRDGAAAWCDYDNDNDLDVIIAGTITSGKKTILYRNDAGTFVNSTVVFPDVSSSSVSWGDYDNDGYADLLIMGLTSTVRITKIFHNNGNGTFTELAGTNFPGLNLGSTSWADYNNDGLLDFFMCGNNGSTYVSKLYLNNGLGRFSEQNTGIPGVTQSSFAWADFNNDGFQDIVISGFNHSGCFSKIYKNNGATGFSEVTGLLLPAIANASIDVGDYDNDGDPDILFTGNLYISPNVTKLYKNEGNFSFTAQNQISLIPVKNGSPRFGDFDNDGDLDIIINGLNDLETGISKVYKNNGGSFEEMKNFTMPDVGYSAAAWGDYDNDNDLDIMITGLTTTGIITKIYKNESVTKNTLPSAPSGLNSLVAPEVLLTWSAPTGDATPSSALTYNLRLGKTSGGGEVISPLSSSTGLRRIPAKGNNPNGTNFKIKTLKKGTYYWSVQAVDNNFAGGAFAPEQTFTYNFDNQASELIFASKSSTSAKCSWTRGNGDNCVVFVKENGTGTAVPVNNTTYTGSKTFGTGTQIGTSGWYCVYNGDLDTATITNLKPNMKYMFQIFEYTGIAGSEVLFTTTGNGNPAQYLPPFTEETQIALTGVSGHTNAWGDYDNDGDLDLVICGYTGSANVAELYKNNGDNTFTKTAVTFANHTYYDFQWGDYDNDNDLDLLVLTDTDSKVYENKGDGTFTAGTALPIMSGGKGLWADFNNDGYKDIIVINMLEMKVLKNNKDKTFTYQSTSMPGLSDGSVACGDYDNDGDLDVLLAGRDGSTAITQIFSNDGNFVFTEQTGIVLPGISNCSLAWADMDNDGDLDIVMSGADFNFYTKIYDNNGNNTFTVIASTTFKDLYRTAMAIGDYDNDGYRDLIVSGSQNGDDYYTVLYRNNGNKTYSEVKTVAFPGIQFGTMNWGDYDNDKDLDLFICGTTATGIIAKVFKNNGSVPNEKPYTPYSIGTITLDGFDVNFKWSRISDSKTNFNGQSYNLYIYEVSTIGFNQSGEGFTQTQTLNGQRLIASFGNIQYSASGYTLKGLPAGDYKCSMQAVDAGMLGSNFATESSFSIYDLTKVGIDCAAKLITNTKTGMQYNYTSTDGVNGTWNSISGTSQTFTFGSGGFDLWIRQASNPKNKIKVAIAAAAQAPSVYTINYAARSTNENVPATIEYSLSSTYANGTGLPASLTPGSTYSFRYKATTSTVASAIQTLVVPALPAAPAISINYLNERTAQPLPSTIEYSKFLDMSGIAAGGDTAISVTPGSDLYFRYKSTSNSFSSPVQTLLIPNRPAAQTFTIDFPNETLTTTLSSAYEYSLSPDVSNAITGNGTKLGIVHGQNVYLRLKATSNTFKSVVQTLIVSARPAAPSNLNVSDGSNTFDWNNVPNYTFDKDYEYSTDGGTNWLVCIGKPVNIGSINVSAGSLKLRLKATNSSFKGAEVASVSAFTTGVKDLVLAGITLYPNPVTDILHLENLPRESVISIYTLSGKLVIQKSFEDKNIKIPITDLPQGMFIIKVKTPEDEFQSKFSKQ